MVFFLTLCWLFGGRSECKIFDNQHKSSEIGSVTARGEILEAFQALRGRGCEESGAACPVAGWEGTGGRPCVPGRRKQLEEVSHFLKI